MRVRITRMLMFATLLFITSKAMAQDSLDSLDSLIPAPNAVILEIGGRGGIYSLNYEYLFSRESGITIGVMMYDENMFSPRFRQRSTRTLAIPASVSYSFTEGNGRMFCDLGITAASVNGGSDDWLLIVPSVGLGYQYRPYESSFLFKGQLLVAFYGPVAIPWGGLSVGHSF